MNYPFSPNALNPQITKNQYGMVGHAQLRNGIRFEHCALCNCCWTPVTLFWLGRLYGLYVIVQYGMKYYIYRL